MKKVFVLAGALALAAGQALATQADGKQVYDMLFRHGTLDGVDLGTELLYSREVTNTIKPKAAEGDTGDIALTVKDQDGKSAELDFRRDGKHRLIGQFPASVGNPMIMYFYESVVHDMAEASGGSPFYIRNRVKEALIKPAEMEKGEAVVDGATVPTVTISMRPFETDPNRDRMKGFGDLELSVTMSDKVPGWYVDLVAEAGPKGNAPIYRSAVSYEGVHK